MAMPVLAEKEDGEVLKWTRSRRHRRLHQLRGRPLRKPRPQHQQLPDRVLCMLHLEATSTGKSSNNHRLHHQTCKRF